MTIAISDRIGRLAPSATLAVADAARALRERGVQVISFGAGEPDFDTPEHIKKAAVEALAAGDTKYPPVAGTPSLKAAITDYLRRYGGLSYEPAEVCVTVGAKDALHQAFAVLVNPGDEVVIPSPHWVSYPDQVRLAGGTPVFVTGQERLGGKIGPAELRAALTPRTRVIVLNSPCNPTGAVYSRAELEALAAVIRETQAVVVSDEIYHRLGFEQPTTASFAALDGMRERTVTVNGFSKSFAMTGWRLGYAAGPSAVISAMVRLQGQTTSGPPSFVQTAAIAALTGDQACIETMRTAYRERAALACAALNRLPGVRCVPPAGAFYCFPDVSGAFARLGVADADEFARVVLERAHVAVVSGAAFGSERHVRVSCATSAPLIEEGLRRMAALLAS
ncbi:MAG: pyridoxal phosphate-dependent aminotransferase [Phycisphaerae bacterium]|jgi:aspartate aminotransferase|nr:pyridoxal phosphate-dependent aminotransferase [Phycisphaerae bacterium]MCZ2401079.1 pyridoxal phosphate-dependent aminotransferase [Phycisphaerae bacterium]